MAPLPDQRCCGQSALQIRRENRATGCESAQSQYQRLPAAALLFTMPGSAAESML
jgi:hypothetical protein